VNNSVLVTLLTFVTRLVGDENSRFVGHGVFLEGLMFGLIADKTLYLKVDNESKPDFTDLGLEAFSYNKKSKEMKLSYFQAPEEALEDLEVMNLWANKAYGAALRAAANKT
jgi:DNA transformation protein and related proteins